MYMYILLKTHQILGITCDNASNNDSMVESLATIMSHFPGEANRARCLAHIVNLVAKIILRQFDEPRKKKKKMDNVLNMLTGNDGGTDKIAVDEKAEKIVDDEEESDEFDDKMDRELDKEEKEMDDGDSDDEDEDSEKLLQDAKILEEAMEEELERVAKKVKPVRQALYKVSPSFFFFSSFFFTDPIPSFFFYL